MPEIALNPPPFNPFSHTGRRERLGVLMPETGDGTQELPKKPTPVSPLAGGLYGEDRLRGLARISAFLSDVDHRWSVHQNKSNSYESDHYNLP